jgi:hypothetical protein
LGGNGTYRDPEPGGDLSGSELIEIGKNKDLFTLRRQMLNFVIHDVQKITLDNQSFYVFLLIG